MGFGKKVKELLRSGASPRDLVESLLKEGYSLKKLKKKLPALIKAVCNKNIKILDTKGRGKIRWLLPVNTDQSIAYWENIKETHLPQVEAILSKK